MKFYLFAYENWKVPVFIQDNKMDSTLFAIHGINSSSDFIDRLVEFSNQFNIVAINLPGSKYFDSINHTTKEDISIINWVKIANFISSKLKTKNNYILAHSMGGGVSVRIADSPIFKKCFNVSTINPSLKNSKLIKIYKQYREPKNFVQQTFYKGVKIGVNYYQKNNDWIKPFADKNSIWLNILDETIMDNSKLDELDVFYRNISNKTVMIVGSLDYIIGTNEFYAYAKSLGIPCLVIGKGHSPISKNPRDFYLFLKKQIESKKRHFWNKLIKLPKEFVKKSELE